MEIACPMGELEFEYFLAQMLCTTTPSHSPLYSQAHILILGVIMYSSFSCCPIWLPCTSSVHAWDSITGYDYVHNVHSVFLGDNLFGQIDTLTTTLNMYVKQTSSNVLVTEYSESTENSFFWAQAKKKFFLTCSNRWFAAALAPVFFRYSDQSKLRFCQFSPTSL